jgi:hypothetical protein
MARKIKPDDPTFEEPAPHVVGASIERTDRIPRLEEDLELVAPGADASGQIEYDERGQARWKISEIPSKATDETFDQLRALTNNRLRLLDDTRPEEQEPVRSSAGGGYNPYETTPKPKPPALKRRPK